MKKLLFLTLLALTISTQTVAQHLPADESSEARFDQRTSGLLYRTGDQPFPFESSTPGYCTETPCEVTQWVGKDTPNAIIAVSSGVKMLKVLFTYDEAEGGEVSYYAPVAVEPGYVPSLQRARQFDAPFALRIRVRQGYMEIATSDSANASFSVLKRLPFRKASFVNFQIYQQTDENWR